MSQPEKETRFKQALNVINQSLEANRDKMPYNMFIQAGESALEGKNIGVAVYADDPDTPHDFYTLKLEGGRMDLVEHGKQDPDITWKVSDAYLDELINNPQQYIDHPEKMDWDWLRDRLGI